MTAPSNPFSTRFVRPGAIDFVFPDGLTASSLVDTLDVPGSRWQVVAPHGFGKSTLLESLARELSRRGRRVVRATITEAKPGMPREFFREIAAPERSAILLDGYESLGLFSRLRLHFSLRGHLHSLLVTAHSDAGFPTLLAPRTDPALAAMIVATLTPEVPSADDLAGLLAAHAGSMRELLFALYDREERKKSRALQSERIF